VATNGSDAADGSPGSPWRTIQHAVDSVGPGDAINVHDGVYGERVAFTASGSPAGGHIVLTSYPGATPAIDGAALTVNPGLDALVSLNGQSYVTVAGLEIRNFVTAVKDRVPVGVYINGSSSDVHFRNLKIHDIESNYDPGGDAVLGADAHGLAVYGDNGPTAISNVLIDGVEIYDCKLGSSEALVINGNVDGFVIQNCIVHDNNNIGICLIGHEGTCPTPASDQARNGECLANLVYNINTTGNQAYRSGATYDRSAGGIYVDGGRDILIDRSISHDCDIGIEIGCEHEGKTVSQVLVRNNFVYSNYLGGVLCGGYDGTVGSAQNCRFVGNTLYHNDTGQNYSGEFLLQWAVANCLFENNIVLALSNSGDAVFVGSPGAAGTTPTGTSLDYNFYFSDLSTSPVWSWGNTEHNTFAAWRGVGHDTNGVYGTDPQLIDPANGNLHLHSASPARDIGHNREDNGAYDIDNLPRIPDAIVDIGADEVPPASTTNGTPTAWLEGHGLVSSNYATADWGDVDGDGTYAWQEYRAGTNPTNTDSVFRLISATRAGEISWLGGTNEENAPFAVLRKTNLLDEAWAVATNYPRALGDNGTNTWVDTTPAGGKRPAFYAISAPN